jgi:hypothetical protein
MIEVNQKIADWNNEMIGKEKMSPRPTYDKNKVKIFMSLLNPEVESKKSELIELSKNGKAEEGECMNL